MSAAFVGEMQLEVVQVTLPGNLQRRFSEQGGKGCQLLCGDWMLHYYDGVVNVAALYEVVPEKELEFMEENECAAGTDLAGIVR